MSVQKPTATKVMNQFRRDMLPPDMTGQPGKSFPLMDSFSKFSMVGVSETKKGLKFVHVTSEKLEGKFTVLIFMDDKLTEVEASEWKEFSNRLGDFREVGARVMGVCTDSHVTIRSMMMSASSLKGIQFPIISDRDGDFSRSFGLLKLEEGKFGAARAVLVLNPELQLIHASLRSERTRARPQRFIQMVKALQNPSIPSSTTASSVSCCPLPCSPYIHVHLPSTISLAEDDSLKAKAKNPKELAMDKPNNPESLAQDKSDTSENSATGKLTKPKATATATKSNTTGHNVGKLNN